MRSTILALGVCFAATACRAPATQILLTIDTDITRPLTVQATVLEGAISPSMAAARARSPGAQRISLGEPAVRFPMQLGIVPKSGSLREGPITVLLMVQSPSVAGQPDLAFDRAVQATFVTSSRQNARVVLRLACNTDVTGCATAGARCTIAQRCAEQNQVCNDEGVCGTPVVEQRPHDTDAGADARVAPADSGVADAADVGVMDVTTDVGVLVDTPPRQLAPLSSSRVTSRRPTLRWSRAAGVTEASVELFADRACTRSITTLTGVDSARPSADLPPGWVFWRVRARAASVDGSRTSPVWQFWVGPRSATGERDTSYGTLGDFNGDGFAEVVVSSNSETAASSVRVYNGSPAGISATPQQVITWMPGGGFGKAVTSAGDVNGDGFADLVVGAWSATLSGKPRCGAILIYHGSASGLATTPARLIEGTAAEERFGMHVAGLGDVNGDGYSDVIAGGPYQNTPGQPSGPGIARLFFGSASGIDPATETYWRKGQAGDWFGFDVAALGDINADGYADFGIHAPRADSASLTDNGQALVVMGAPAFAVLSPGRQATDGTYFSGTLAGELFGGLYASGDVNGDGFGDVLLAGDAPAGGRRGRVALYLGSVGGMSATPNNIFDGTTAGEQLGFCAALGDVDNDGFDDALFGAPTAPSAGIAGVGYATLYRGGPSGLSTAALRRFDPPAAVEGLFGFSVSIMGDINGDRAMDLGISQPSLALGGRSNNGRLFVHHGGSTTAIARTIDGAAADEYLGFMIGR
ncbi:MAG: FG-GAP repeat protein [Myxococcales bacterium]|nr:FG-GAP repeat protein [Myxococcales bacterium]